MKKILKNLTLCSLVIMILVSFAGCSLTSKNSKDNAKKENTVSTGNISSESKFEQDKKKTEELKKNKEVSDGQVYIENNTVTATMVIKNDVKESDAKALAEKYAKELKEKYSDKPVNVQAVKNNKNVADVTLK